MKIKTILVASASVTAIGFTAHSCVALATSTVGVAIIKQVLLGGISKGLGVLKNKDTFKQSDLVEKALPSQLREINSVLGKIAPSLLEKEKDYIAQAAAYTANISEPILTNAVNSLTTDDVTRIAQGGSGMATQILKEKTSAQLVAAISPKVDEKLNEFGIVKSINTALKGNNLLGSLLGGNTSNLASGGLSKLASEQIVNGLFNVVEDYEKQNSQKIFQALGK